MTARELEALLQQLSGYSQSEIDQRIRPLRAANLIPHGPRGSNAPHMQPIDTVFALFAMISRRAVDAGPTAVRASALKLARRPEIDWYSGATLLEVLEDAFTTYGPNINRFEALSDGSAAWIELDQDGKSTTALFVEEKILKSKTKNKKYENFGSALCNHRFIVGRKALSELNGEFKQAGIKSRPTAEDASD